MSTDKPTQADERADFAALLAQAETQVAALAADNAVLLEKMLKQCSMCGGRGVRRTSCTLCGDSTLEHECDDRDVICTGGVHAFLAQPHPGAALLERLARARSALERLNTEAMALHDWDRQGPPDGGLYGEAEGIFTRLQAALSDACRALAPTP
ncbi:hypothetical protein [Myxococcus sp. CA040A]|uniref:hypothetical protein n=1 Tax=Myxococcus sp. CA040A TaxID=2741738 RepID=UPI00157B36F4|nr:hypothetical protein [Myxococcus sp. CA040A]NTX08957.1 hypothetical protein [Myxococcus sp. CA040A]